MIITDELLSTITFSTENVGKTFRNFYPSKANGRDNISICLLEIFGDPIYKPLEMIFNQTLISGLFPIEWKKNLYRLHFQKTTNKI